MTHHDWEIVKRDIEHDSIIFKCFRCGSKAYEKFYIEQMIKRVSPNWDGDCDLSIVQVVMTETL